MRALLWWGCALSVPLVHAGGAATLLDDFARPDAWHAEHTDDVAASLRGEPGALCLDFDFHGVSGSASLKRALPLVLPANFAIDFGVRGRMPANTLQLKLIDASGDNVWMFQQPHFVPSAQGQRLAPHKRDLPFAWGPTGEHELKRAAAVELVVYAEQGGAGELCFDQLSMQALPPETAAATPSPSLDREPGRYIEQQARQAPRGMYPRGFVGEQSYWTLVGSDGGGRHAALLSEDGAVEVDKGGWSLEPMLLTEHGLRSWADAQIDQRLLDGYLPIPSVAWQVDDLRLDTTVVADGSVEHPRLLLDYELRNQSERPRRVTLALLARPFQVNPPTQFLNTPGGIAPIHRLAWSGSALRVDGALQLIPLQDGARFVAARYADGNLPERLARGKRPEVSALDDPRGLAQGALLYTLQLPPHGSRRLGLAVAREGLARPADGAAWLAGRQAEVAQAWREKLNRVRLDLPPGAAAIADTARSALAQILMSRDGPALQPGTRSYARSWVRDGAMMSEGLARSGHADVAADFVHWYAPHQFSNGKVPCCVDWRGSDPVPENDSHGELIFAIAELWRYRHDRAEIVALWPHVEQAVTYMDRLRESERGADRQTSDRRALYGLMPASISHEGYSAKPMHSYWDDFWALQGYDDAVVLAQALGQRAQAARIARSRDAFKADLLASIGASMAAHRIDYLPGAAELGDFDATSTTIALSPGDGPTWLPQGALASTFERYWRNFVARRDGRLAWQDYTPYELRTLASFVRLGWRGRLGELMAFFMADRRPGRWNQWAEVVGRDPRKPRFVGDMPHAWIASDYLRSVYDLFAYERSGDHAMVLAAGLDPTWFAGDGVGIERLRTPYGELGYRLRERAGRLVLTLDAGQRPPGGWVFPWPYPGTPVPGATLDGKPVAWQGRELPIDHVPATLVLAMPGTAASR